MTDREVLYRGVCASPEDDVPRLVFADFLEENGEEERAEFIRLQIELARRADWATPLEHVAGLGGVSDEGIRSRLGALLERNARDWAGRWIAVLPEVAFARGFPDAARTDGRVWTQLEQTAEFFRETPARSLVLHHVGLDEAAVPVLAGAGIFARVARLEITGLARSTPAGRARLFREDCLPAVRQLVFRQTAFLGEGNAGLLQLVASPLMRRVDRLGLPAMALGDDQMAVLDLPALDRLVELDLTDNRITNEGLRRLAHSRHLTNLRVLRLKGNPLGRAEAVEILTKSGMLARLAALDLTVTNVTQAEDARRRIEAVAPGLRHLEVGHRLSFRDKDEGRYNRLDRWILRLYAMFGLLTLFAVMWWLRGCLGWW